MDEQIQVTVNSVAMRVAPGTSAAAAVMNVGFATRKSLSGEARAPLCGMGICFECCAKVDGEEHVRTCQVVCRPGMVITTDGH